jgi:hypothetical protein
MPRTYLSLVVGVLDAPRGRSRHASLHGAASGERMRRSSDAAPLVSSCLGLRQILPRARRPLRDAACPRFPGGGEGLGRRGAALASNPWPWQRERRHHSCRTGWCFSVQQGRSGGRLCQAGATDSGAWPLCWAKADLHAWDRRLAVCPLAFQWCVLCVFGPNGASAATAGWIEGAPRRKP